MTLLSYSSQQKNKKRGGKRSLPSSSHFYHHFEAPLVGALLKLLTLETPLNFMFLELRAT